MENVKGILSAKTAPDAPAGSVIEKIFSDLKAPSKAIASDQTFLNETKKLGIGFNSHDYVLFPFPASEQRNLFSSDGDGISKKDFTIKSEKYNIPQTRHRVIICGVRMDVYNHLGRPGELSEASSIISVKDMIGSLPKLRSEVTKEKVSAKNWSARVKKEVADLTSIKNIDIADGCNTVEYPSEGHVKGNVELARFIEDSIGSITSHRTRSHMISDLARYYFCADFAEREGKSPKIEDWPVGDLVPNHTDINQSGNRPSASGFSDRFKVQVWDKPCSTITSHISKDGHYFIHPDKSQCRSLSVREAARIQTFPDSYQFCGGISKQFHQIGNAVPPYLAYQIAKIISGYLKHK
jgi:DNA (cytosine-5)-methyltransferase 1